MICSFVRARRGVVVVRAALLAGVAICVMSTGQAMAAGCTNGTTNVNGGTIVDTGGACAFTATNGAVSLFPAVEGSTTTVTNVTISPVGVYHPGAPIDPLSILSTKGLNVKVHGSSFTETFDPYSPDNTALTIFSYGAATLDTTGGAANSFTTKGYGIHLQGKSVSVTLGADTINAAVGIMVSGADSASVDASGTAFIGGSGYLGVDVLSNGKSIIGGNGGFNGSITDYAYGLRAITNASSNGVAAITVGSQGSVVVTGDFGYAITLEGTAADTTATFDNFGTVDGSGAQGAVLIENFPGAAFSSTSTFESGSVTKGLFAGGLGNDTVNLVAGADIANATFKGNGGTDAIFLKGAGDGTLDAGTVSGFSSLEKDDAGTWSLTGSPETFGSITIAGGTLDIDDVLGDTALTVKSGGTLGGTGTVHSVTIPTGATLAPGDHGIGALTVSGDLTMTTGATLAADVSGSANDLVTVTGKATVDGTLIVTSTGGAYKPNTKVTLLTAAGGVTGTFSGFTVANSFGTNVKLAVAYDANNVYLDFLSAHITPNLPGNHTSNQSAVTQSIDSAVDSGASPPDAFGNLGSLSASDLANASTQLSGEIGGDVASAGTQMLNPFLNMLVNGANGDAPSGGTATSFMPQMLPATASSLGIASPHQAQSVTGLDLDGHRRAWVSVFGAHESLDGTPTTVGSHDLSGNFTGIAGGVDAELSPGFRLGASVAGGHGTFGLFSALGGGKSDVIETGIYGSKHFGDGGYISAAGAYAWHSMSTHRVVTVGGTDVLTASFDAKNYGGRVEGGYRATLDQFTGLTPYAAVQAQEFEAPAYSEKAVSGSSTFALSYASRDSRQTQLELGARADRIFAMSDGGTVLLSGRAAWGHGTTIDRSVAASFQALPGATFTVDAAQPDKDLALVGLNLQVLKANGLTIAVGANADLGSRSQTSYGDASLTYRW